MRTHTDRDIRMLVARSSVPSHIGQHVPLNLAGADLEMADLPHVDFRGANLQGANLRGAMLWGALLDDACLDGTDFTCANLTWCDLCRCSMKGALLVEADLDEALVDGGIGDAVVVRSNMITINFNFDTLPDITQMNEEDPALDEATRRARKRDVPSSLRARVAAGIELLKQAKRRVLTDDDLQELLRWSASTGKPLNLRGCNLSGANLRNAPLRGACLAFTNALGADIHGVDLTGADLRDSCGWDRA